jgi:hypothetical protein
VLAVGHGASVATEASALPESAEGSLSALAGAAVSSAASLGASRLASSWAIRSAKPPLAAWPALAALPAAAAVPCAGLAARMLMAMENCLRKNVALLQKQGPYQFLRCARATYSVSRG